MRKNESRRAGFGLGAVLVLSVAASAMICRAVGFGALFRMCVSLAMPGARAGEYSVSEEAEKTYSLFGSGGKTDEKEDQKTAAVSVNGLAYTPQDIADIIASEKQNSANDVRGGGIKEMFYGADSANEKYGSILIKNTTGRKIDYGALLKAEADYSQPEGDEPKVLVFHTHTSECYQPFERDFYAKSFSPRSSDLGRNMVRVGDEITAALEKHGISVVHDRTIYDSRYTGAYDRSGVGVDKMLEKYPSVQVVIDVHRDAIQYDSGIKVKPTAKINGKKAAQIMTITGCEGGGITDFPDWEQNLCFALKLQKTANEMYPGLMRPLFFCNRRYNMYKSHCSVLLEMGSDANTLDEAVYSGRLIGDAMGKMLKEMKKNGG